LADIDMIVRKKRKNCDFVNI